MEATREEMVMDYQQTIRDVIKAAVDREIQIFQAASTIEMIIRAEIDGDE